MIVSRAAFTLITIAALAATWWTVYHFVVANGGDLVHAYATPACLELAALSAAYRYHRTDDRWALLMFWLPLIATVAINAAHGYPNYVLMAVYMLPPVTVVGVGDLLLRDIADAQQAKDDAAQADAQAAKNAARRNAQAAARPAAQAGTSNGHKPSMVNGTVERLAALVPDPATDTALLAEHGTIGNVAAHLDVTRHQYQAHRRRIGAIKA